MKSLLVSMLLLFGLSAQAQKRFSEGSMSASIRSYEGDEKRKIEVKGVFLFKGAHYRSTLTSDVGTTNLIYDSREGVGAVHHDYGAQRIMIPLNKMQWEDKNNYLKSKDIQFDLLKDTLRILGFLCKTAVARLSDSSLLTLYYTEDMIPENTDVEWQFPQINGLVLSLMVTSENRKMEMVAEQMSFDPVPIQQFNLSNLGYRVLNYWDSKKMK